MPGDELADCVREDGSLYNLNWFLRWVPDEEDAILDGRFTAAQLRAIADHMEKFGTHKE